MSKKEFAICGLSMCFGAWGGLRYADLADAALIVIGILILICFGILWWIYYSHKEK